MNALEHAIQQGEWEPLRATIYAAIKEHGLYPWRPPGQAQPGADGRRYTLSSVHVGPPGEDRAIVVWSRPGAEPGVSEYLYSDPAGRCLEDQDQGRQIHQRYLERAWHLPAGIFGWCP